MSSLSLTHTQTHIYMWPYWIKCWFQSFNNMLPSCCKIMRFLSKLLLEYNFDYHEVYLLWCPSIWNACVEFNLEQCQEATTKHNHTMNFEGPLLQELHASPWNIWFSYTCGWSWNMLVIVDSNCPWHQGFNENLKFTGIRRLVVYLLHSNTWWFS